MVAPGKLVVTVLVKLNVSLFECHVSKCESNAFLFTGALHLSGSSKVLLRSGRDGTSMKLVESAFCADPWGELGELT